ncbi:MAG TPA: UDP-N-acetylmuramoyl-L-alanyl-D-glutamate--2,6-diaminopimelate ligase [Xanthomonadales bacterium]|nr:UDP-N-acetylmuramoyl-L-alanyl-D-glutamate--2,6-diaminopimelate ligase [Xanthomonadales bacterium]
MWQKAKNQYHLSQALLANIIYGFPSRKLKVIGVTGTDGKTTTASLLYHILNKAGYKASLISSVGAVISNKESDIGFHVTTPGRFALQSYLKKSKKLGVEYVVLEITSHALDQYRAYGIPIAVGVLTNISNEHLDYHKTYEKYAQAKAKLLKKANIAIINKDDKSYLLMKKILQNKKIITYGFKKDSNINPHNFPFTTKLLGKFNVYNSLAAIAALRQLHIPDAEIKSGVASFTPPVGRQEIVYDKDFMVINDFAHTPNSFAVILPEVKKITKNKLIHVFGAAGKRDKYKRSEMGKISSIYADIMILTGEDPRNETVESINQEIMSGITNPKFGIVNYDLLKKGEVYLDTKNKYIISISDRREAIDFAISLAKKGDTVILTGKGHEKSINYGKGEEPWDERKVALEAIRRLKI